MRSRISKLPILYLIALVTVSGLSISCRSNEILSVSQEIIIEDIDKLVSNRVDSGYSGIVFWSKRDSVLLHRAYGKEVSVSKQNVFSLASSTKTLTATVILKLIELGQIGMDDTIDDFFKNSPQEFENISIYNLLTHSSGLGSSFVTDGITNRQDAVDKIFDTGLKFTPGSQWRYSNDGYILLAAIIEEITEQTYEENIRRYIFEPAEMNHSGFWGEYQYNDPNLVPFNEKVQGMPFFKKMSDGLDLKNNWGQKGNSGVFSTAGDMNKFVVAFMEGKLISRDLVKSALKGYVTIRGSKQAGGLFNGFGWFVKYENEKIQHSFMTGRSDWIHNNRIYLLEDAQTIIVFARDNGPKSTAFGTSLAQQILTIVD